ncbi:hypothetical protein VNI00_016989 [Paramarasmius palmivorus]|uniref:Uncharacterized protein n=1 Tax=Paramarasmius palmivorus TaxID=297713 RepID=A0AAW0BB57_9AGAR
MGMSTLSVDDVMLQACVADPDTLQGVLQFLSAPIPGGAEDEGVVLQRCKGAAVALEVFTVYLHPYPFGQLHRVTTLPGLNAQQTYNCLLRWFCGLLLWSPSFVGSRMQPQAIMGTVWYNKVLNAVFDLVYVFIQHYPHTPLCRLLRVS